MWNRELAIVDIETTGLTARYNRVIEVAVLKVRDGELIETYSTLVDPEIPISSFIEELTGITDRELRYAPTFGAVRRELFGLLDGALFVAHNATFDYGFLREEFRRVEMDFSAGCLCTMRLSRRLFPDHRRHSLDAIMGRFGLTCADRHRALGDAMVVWDFMKCLETRVQGEELSRAVAGATKTPAATPAGCCPAI
jgi:DNA polymerase-3 subunit epsilon